MKKQLFVGLVTVAITALVVRVVLEWPALIAWLDSDTARRLSTASDLAGGIANVVFVATALVGAFLAMSLRQERRNRFLAAWARIDRSFERVTYPLRLGFRQDVIQTQQAVEELNALRALREHVFLEQATPSMKDVRRLEEWVERSSNTAGARLARPSAS